MPASSIERRVVVAASFTATPLERYLGYWTERLWPGCALELAPYGQLLEQVRGAAAEPGGAIRRVDVLLLRPEDLLRSADGRLSRTPAVRARARAYVEELAHAVATVSGAAPTLLVGLAPASPGAGATRALASFDRWARTTLEAALERAGGAAHLLDLDGARALYGVVEIGDAFRDELAHIPFSDEYLAATATAIARALRALWDPPRKAIALDCDNTLWGGACGEEPLEALEPRGPYAALREFMGEQARAGSLLCLVSRNRERDVVAAFARCATPLRLEQIAARAISFGRKSAGIVSLARELGLAVEDFIFVDDDAVECAEVRAALPGVAVVQLPGEVAQIPRALAQVWEFDRLLVTEEDRVRGAAYATEARRRRERERAPSARAFVEGLEVEVEAHRLSEENVARAAQLFARTNQFNLTGARCSAQELSGVAAREDAEVLVIAVRDRLGDYGVVGALALRYARRTAFVGAFALSCRVLRRGVEGRVLLELARRAQARGCGALSIAFRPTGRNDAARELLERLADSDGRHAAESPGGAMRRYDLKLCDLAARVGTLDPCG